MSQTKINHPVPRPRASVATKAPRGFGLVELMVAMVIALVILAALVALFIGTSRNNREMATANSLIDNGRFAIPLLESDLVHAGFWGTHVPRYDDQTSDAVPADVPGSVPDPCLAYDVTNWNNAYTNLMAEQNLREAAEWYQHYAAARYGIPPDLGGHEALRAELQTVCEHLNARGRSGMVSQKQ